MAGLKKPTILRQSSCNSLPLIDSKTTPNSSELLPTPTKINPLGVILSLNTANILHSKENDINNNNDVKVKKFSTYVSDGKENVSPNEAKFDAKKKNPVEKLWNSKDRALKPSSLQLCIQMNEPDSSFGFGSKLWDDAGPEDTESAKSVNVWDFSDSEAAPVSSWSTLPNRALLCRALPMDVGKCTCIIQKEAAPQGLGGGSLYSLYTSEGHGRQNRTLAVAYHKRRNGRSFFVIAQSAKGVLSPSDDSFIGVITANLMGSRYCIWDQGRSHRKTLAKESKILQAIVEFTPTITTWTGRHRSIRAWIPKLQNPAQLKNSMNQAQQVKRQPLEWEGKKEQDQVQQLISKVPYYNKISKQYELDFREKVRGGLKIQSSVKNFQLATEGNPRQPILQLGRVGKSMYMLDYRHPLTGFQAFCICLASIDPKLCCTV